MVSSPWAHEPATDSIEQKTFIVVPNYFTVENSLVF